MTDHVTTLNVSITSLDWRGQALSNFCMSPFILEGLLFASIEGFIQGIKFPETDARRVQAFQLSGWEAKKLGSEADRSGPYWKGARLDYGSTLHHQLIESAIRARIIQSEGLQATLLSTQGAVLIHETGHEESPNTSLPAVVFCNIMTTLRDELIKSASAGLSTCAK